MNNQINYYNWKIEDGDWQVHADDYLISYKKKLRRENNFKLLTLVLVYLAMFMVIFGGIHLTNQSDFFYSTAKSITNKIVIK